MRSQFFTALLCGFFAICLTGCILTKPSYGGGFKGASPTEDPAASDARYTVELARFNQPNHKYLADRYKTSLQQGLKWQGLYIVASGRGSALYWGAFEDEASADRTLQQAIKYRAPNGLMPFLSARVVDIPGKKAPYAQWEFSNCPGEYSLLVAVFENRREDNYSSRRHDAEQYCLQLRQQGRQSWYQHKLYKSLVMVGSFGPDAIETRHVRVPNLAGAPVLQEKRVPVDPQLLSMMEKYPYLAYNGHTVYLTQKDANGNIIHQSETPDRSYPVRVPHNYEAQVPSKPSW